MKLKGLAVATSVAAFAFGAAIAGYAAEEAKWSYEGPESPAHWSEINPAFAACGAGREQSPIDLQRTHAAEPEKIEISWQAFEPEVVNTGRTIQAEAPAGSYTTFDGRRYDLLQLHFHHKSEHTLDGEQLPMEAHFVHKSPQGDLLVLGVFLVPGRANDALKTILDSAPRGKGSQSAEATVDLRSLVPDDSAIFRYAGSLTTPPCSEVVSWVVFDRPVEVSPIQIKAFAGLYPSNFRPTQPINRRFVLFGF